MCVRAWKKNETGAQEGVVAYDTVTKNTIIGKKYRTLSRIGTAEQA